MIPFGRRVKNSKPNDRGLLRHSATSLVDGGISPFCWRALYIIFYRSLSMRPGLGRLCFSVTHAFNVSHTRLIYDLPKLLSFPNSRLSKCQSNFGNVTVSPSARRYGHSSPKPQDSQPKPNNEETSHGRKRKGKNSLRRVAVEAQRSRDSKSSETSPVSPIQATTKVSFKNNICIVKADGNH